MLNSASVEVEVEVEAELGKILFMLGMCKELETIYEFRRHYGSTHYEAE